MSDMTRTERDELAKLVRRREKLAKADADTVAAERLADFEHQMASVYKPADDEVWQELRAAAAQFVREVDDRLAERCRELGIPEQFRPSIEERWYSRGENASRERRVELRAMAKTRIDADARRAKAEIERRSVEVQTELISGGLESDEARRFLASMPTANALMPAAPSVAELEASEAAPSRLARRLAALSPSE